MAFGAVNGSLLPASSYLEGPCARGLCRGVATPGCMNRKGGAGADGGSGEAGVRGESPAPGAHSGAV